MPSAFSRVSLLLVSVLAGCYAGEPGPGLRVFMAGEPVRVDGRLDEPAWRAAEPVLLTQQSPRPGEPTPFRTEVRVLLAGRSIYFGFSCTDAEPDRIAVHTMQFDGAMGGDDTVTVVLDPYGDRRTGYAFKINAAGARADGLINDPEHISSDWDGIWDARTARTADGWSAEIEIPLHTLNFIPGQGAWGLNLERTVAREHLVLRWASPTLDSFTGDMSRAGVMSGMENVEQGRGLEFTPYWAGRTNREFGAGARTWLGAGGFDFTWRMTPQMAAVLTLNTDFAETEVDSRQINITRFPLFFPEKRAFFLEGSNQFEFGPYLGRAFIPFFSRRIGLLEGRQVPIDAGVKLNGRAGRWQLALLDVQTRSTSFAPAVNLFAGRTSYDVNRNLRVGALLTNGDPAGRKRNTLAGFDALWRTSRFRGNKNLLIGGWTAFSAGDLQPGRRTGWGYKVDYPNDLLTCYISTQEFGDALTPLLGYLPRPGTRQHQGGCRVSPRPAKNGSFGWIRQVYFANHYTRTTNLKGINESWSFQVTPLWAQLESGEILRVSWAPQYEFLAAPFMIVPGLAIAPGAYRFDRFTASAMTSVHRPFIASFVSTWGTFYDGTLTQHAGTVNWTSPRGRIELGLGGETNFGHLKAGNFVQRLWQLKTNLAWNPRLVLSSFVQYDSLSRNLGANTRLRWTMRPNREFFLVWNRGWLRPLERPDLAILPESEMLAVKFRWTFRI
ncbi:MAG: carbohydrate binding family 9 domain-containing protein [Bryobacterales bacterium]|nr:carbohydrate binding family 9 domain-containing protein [Bryobacterales bacterium]